MVELSKENEVQTQERLKEDDDYIKLIEKTELHCNFFISKSLPNFVLTHEAFMLVRAYMSTPTCSLRSSANDVDLSVPTIVLLLFNMKFFKHSRIQMLRCLYTAQ